MLVIRQFLRSAFPAPRQAAQKSISTQVLTLGGKCKVMLTLYDLKRSASKKGTAVSGGCAESQIVESREKADGFLEVVPIRATLHLGADGHGTMKLRGNPMTSEKPSVAIAIDFVEEPGRISVKFHCTVCGGEFVISGSPTDPNPPAVIPCPRCGRQVLLAPAPTAG